MSKKNNLINIVDSTLDEKYDLIEKNFPDNQYSEIEYDKERDETEETQGNDTDEEGDLECNISEIIPAKRRKRCVDIIELTSTRIKNRVGTLEKLPNGLTPYEMMYGKQDDDYDIISKSID